MKYTEDDPTEIILGVCEYCNNYVPFLRMPSESERIYKCMTCKTKHKQHINGKVTFDYLGDTFLLKNK